MLFAAARPRERALPCMAYDTMAHCTEGVPRFSSLSFNFGLRQGRPAIGQHRRCGGFWT
jgi:hypothetical protein